MYRSITFITSLTPISPAPTPISRHPFPRWRGSTGRELRRVDADVQPRMLPVRVLLVAADPWLQQRVLDRVHVERPRVVRGHELRHAAVQLVALRAIGEHPRLAIQLVVSRQVEARVVRLSDVLPVQQLRERV